MSLSILVLLGGLVAQLAPADLGPLSAEVRWLQTERLRGNLRHRPNIEPFVCDVLEAPGGGSAAVELRGPHVLLLLLARGERAAVRLAAIDGHWTFPDTIWAAFSPEGAMTEVGEVAPGQAGVVRIAASTTGLYRLLINTGPASSNACRVTVRARRWAIEALGIGHHMEDALYYHSVRDLALAGMNLDMLDFEGLRQEFVTDAGLDRWTAAVGRWGEYARRFKLRLMPAVDLGGTRWEVQAWEGCRPGLYIKHYEKYPLAPCPLDRTWWEKVYLRRGLAVARLSLDNPWIVGYGLDPEMYQCWHYGHYMLSGTCFCDHCLGGFLRKTGRSTDVLTRLKTGAERHEWLKKQGLMGEYDRYLEEETYKIACWLREELHKVNPRLLLCVYVLEIGNWFCRGLARGLGTPQVPVIDYAEATYCPGWSQSAERHMERFRQWGAHVAYGGALWYQFHPPTNSGGLPAQMYNFCMRAAGYWFWPGQVLHQDWKSVPAHNDVLASQADYWHAITQANREIQRKMQSPATYLSPLASITAHKVWTPKSKPEDGYKRVKVELLPVRLSGPARLYFWVPPKAHRIELTVQAPGKDNGAEVSLIRPDGSQAAKTSGELDEARTFSPLPTPGVWCLEVKRAHCRLEDVGVRLSGVPPYLCTGSQALLRPTLKAGPVMAYWPMDEGAGDSVADKSGPPPANGRAYDCRWAQGVRGSCLEFDGDKSRVAVRRSYNLDGLREFTFSAWVKLRSLPERGHGFTIINKGPEAPVQHVWWWIGYPPHHSLVLEMGNEKYKWGVSFASGPLEWKMNRWYHVAVAFKCDGKRSQAWFYRDGQLVGTTARDEELHTADYDIILGAYPGRIHVMDGFIDEVKIFDKALGEDEVRKLAAPRAGGG